MHGAYRLTTKDDAYLLLHELGSGGMATVYIAVAEHTPHRPVAIKLPRRHMGLFLQERQLVQTVQHKNVVPVLHAGASNLGPYIAFELVDGLSLASVFRGLAQRQQRMPTSMAVHIASEIAAGLDAIHRQQIVHSDINPPNVMISSEGRVMICDFGVAQRTDRALPAQGLRGKLRYQSPEQCRGAAPDRRSDVFSLGVLLYEALAGERMFPRRRFETSEAVRAIRDGEIPTLYDRVWVDDELARLVERALVPDPRQRFQTADHLRRHLLRWQQRRGSPVSPDSIGRMVSELGSTPIESSISDFEVTRAAA